MFTLNLSTDILQKRTGLGKSVVASTAFHFLLVCLFFVFLSRLDDSYVWYHDGGIYLQIARNLSLGSAYNHLITAQLLPPGYPVILAIWGAFFSWKIVSFKILNLVALLLTASGTYVLLARVWGYVLACMVGIAVFTSPALILWIDAIATEFVFSALLVWSLICWRNALRAAEENYIAAGYAVAAVILTSYAILTRALGTAILVAATIMMLRIIFSSTQKRTKIYLGVVILAGWVLGILCNTAIPDVNQFFLGRINEYYAYIFRGGDGFSVVSYIWGRFIFESANLGRTLSVTVPAVDELAPYLRANLMDQAIPIALAFVVFVGALKDNIPRINIIGCFAGIYISSIILVSWSAGSRYLLPVVPFLILYFAIGIGSIVSALTFRRSRLQSKTTLIVFCGALAAAYASQTLLWSKPRHDDATSAPERAMGWILANTQEGELVCVFRSGDITYFTGRTTCWPDPVVLEKELSEPGALAAAMKKMKAKYYILPLNPYYRDYLIKIKSDTTLQVIYREEQFVVLSPRGNDS